MKTLSKFDSRSSSNEIKGFCAHVIVPKSRVYCLWGCGWMVGVRVYERREGDMNPEKLVLVVVWDCSFIVYCCTEVVHATSVRIPSKDTLSLSC